jgi:hypothetical protein
LLYFLVCFIFRDITSRSPDIRISTR